MKMYNALPKINEPINDTIEKVFTFSLVDEGGTHKAHKQQNDNGFVVHGAG